MGITADQSAYGGMPIEYEIADDVDWEEFAPRVGGIQPHTSILDSEEWYPAGSYSLCDEERTIPALWDLAREPAARAQLDKNALRVYSEIRERIPTTSPFHKLAANAPAVAQKEFIDALIAPTGLEWFENANEGNLFAYARVICRAARLPHYTKEFVETVRGFPQKLISFPVDGKKLSPSEQALLEKEFHRVYCRINGYVFDLHGPGHSEIGVLIDSDAPEGASERNSLNKLYEVIDRLRHNKKGGFQVSVPTAYETSAAAPNPRRLKFNRQKRINLVVPTAAAAQALSAHWARFGQKVTVEKTKEKT